MLQSNVWTWALASMAFVLLVAMPTLAEPKSRKMYEEPHAKGQPPALPVTVGPVTQRQLRSTTVQRNEPPPPPSEKDAVVDPERQHWGLAEVRPGARLFYWLYLTRAVPATPTARPLVLWLQGGPGVSASGYGNFEELGVANIHLQPRNLTWVNDVNVLFVDSPVGTGFSTVDGDHLLPSSNQQVADDLVAFTRIFMRRYPDFIATPLYIFSEAYGGKMAAQFALQLSRAVSKGEVPANLKGLAMGDPWIAPVDAIQSWAPYLLYQILRKIICIVVKFLKSLFTPEVHKGLIDQRGHDRIMTAAQNAQKAAMSGQWRTATALWNATEWLVMKETGGINTRNILTRIPTDVRHALGSITDSMIVLPSNMRRSMQNPSAANERGQMRNHKPRSRHNENEMDQFMNLHIAPRLKLPNQPRWVGISDQVFAALAEDFMKPATTAVEQLLNETAVEVSVFSSQLDLVANSRSTSQWVESLKWAGIRHWQDMPRKALPVSGMVEGDRKNYGNLAVYWIRRVGQLLPAENPRVGRELLRRVTNFDLHEILDYVSDRS